MIAADPLARFSSATQAWFRSAFAGPTKVQVQAWEAIGGGRDCLVIAPTGSGKTLAAFLSSIDQLTRDDGDDQGSGEQVSTDRTPGQPGVRVLYISPLKALGVDVERNLKIPLQGIAAMAAEQGVALAEVRVGVRSGDTPAADRRRLVAHPPQILITTPESLFLMLSSGAAAILSTVTTVIVDEIHCLAGTKRGAHLALSLERVDALAATKPQRIGLSATVRPPEAVAGFLGGRDRQVSIIQPPATKTWQLDVTVPVEDMTELAAPKRAGEPGKGRGQHGSPPNHRGKVGNDRQMKRQAQPDQPPKPSIWPHVEQQIFDLVMAHHSTICFCNSRGVAERLTNHLNELYHQTAPYDPEGVIARTHHGSISKALRSDIEADLKAGRLPCVVATNSLELGIDMGAVDLVIQVGAPPSVASGLQRIGRGGHQVDAISHGVLFPLSRSDLLATAVVTERMAEGAIEAVHRLVNPLDVLAQHLVSMCLDAPQRPETLFEMVRRADPFTDLPAAGFDAVVDMLTGKYPSDDFVELRPRLVWDRTAGTLVARPGARRLVTTSGGTIPDRGLYGVFMAGADPPGSGKRAASRRVGELDEEMVYESRVGDIFTLGSSAWRIDQINPNQVIVTPVPGQTGRLPFWKGDDMSRSAEVGQAIGRFVAELGDQVRGEVSRSGEVSDQRVNLGPQARQNLMTYIRDQLAATGVLPDDRTIVVERHRDELGAWRVCIHCQVGRAVLRPWSMAIQAGLRQAFGLAQAQNVQTFITDDGITLRLGEVENPMIGELLGFDPDQITRIVAQETEHSALFAAHFRQCAARALLLPRRDPGKRSPLWQQRLRSSQLLGVAASYPDFPIMAEALRECLNDVFDLEALRQLMRDIAARRVRIVEVETPKPSPFASSLLFGYAGAFMYDGDLPLAERAAAASLVDPGLLAGLLGTPSALLDEDAALQVEEKLQRLAPGRHASTMEALWDMLREIGPLTEDECAARCDGESGRWLEQLEAAGRVVVAQVGGSGLVAVSEDAQLLAGLPDQASLLRLVRRWVRCHVIVTAGPLAGRFGADPADVASCLADLASQGVVESGTFVEGEQPQYVTSEVLARVRRHAIAAVRAQVKPVEQRQFASFLVRWQELDRPASGLDGVAAAVEQLAGCPIPASMLDSVVLPTRAADYQPSMLDQLMLSGDVSWTGHGSIGGTDGWICLWPTDLAPLVVPPPLDDLTQAARAVFQRLSGGGAWGADALAGEDLSPAQVTSAIWELAWSGWITSDTLAPVRSLSASAGALRRPHVPRVRRVVGPTRPGGVRRPPIQQGVSGRWFAVNQDLTDDGTARLVQAVGLELGRYGVLTRGSVLSEAMTPGFFDAYRVASAMEDQGSVRRGYFIRDLGAAQFAIPGAVDRLRESSPTGLTLLAACDPANPWGAALAWPESMGHRPARKAGALVVLDNGFPVIYLERGVHTLVTFAEDPAPVGAALRLVGDWIDRHHLDTITVTRINAQPALEARQWTAVLEQAGFTMTPQGFRRRAK